MKNHEEVETAVELGKAKRAHVVCAKFNETYDDLLRSLYSLADQLREMGLLVDNANEKKSLERRATLMEFLATKLDSDATPPQASAPHRG